MVRKPQPELVRLLQIIYGPDDWQRRASRSLGIKPSSLRHIRIGRRGLTTLALRRIQRALLTRVSDRQEELAILHAALDRRYAAHEALIPEAKQILTQMIRERGIKP